MCCVKNPFWNIMFDVLRKRFYNQPVYWYYKFKNSIWKFNNTNLQEVLN